MPTFRTAIALLLLLSSAATGQEVNLVNFNAHNARIEHLESELASMRERLDRGVAVPETKCELCEHVADACLCDGATCGLYGGAALVIAKLHFKEAFQATTLDAVTGTLNLVPFEYNYKPNARGWIGYTGPDGLGLRTTYGHLDQSADPFRETSSATSLHSAQVVTVNIPAAIAAPPGDTLMVDSSLNVQTLDLEGTLHTHLAGMRVLAGGGVRYARLDQDSIATVLSGGTPTQQLNWERKFSGWGPTISAEFQKPIGVSGLAVYGSGRGSLLFGEKSLSRFVNPAAGAIPPVPFARLSGGDEVVPIFDIGLGVEWSQEYASNELFVRATYEGQLWAEAGAPTLGFLGFEGFTLQVGVQH